ncbi:RlpA-like double-psi beta-barrel-protein domain-containing protein-containing protein [Choanephora cucurbitarum]|nr:RlpA-like double-psi beta-barrel-protein domain-containing protein-containing protein [Choanephora cucurbitarum]
MQITSFLLFLIASLYAMMGVESAPIEARGSMSGRATYYNVGLGSCGKTNSDGEMVAALSGSFMSKKYCGRSITVKGGKGSVTVKVVDTCPGCGKGDVDLSPAAFKKLGALSKGVIPITWSL